MRSPLQQRSSNRIANFLAVAAELLAEVGYEAMTMTAIAERADASIGALYRWFPDKTSIAQELRVQFGQELELKFHELFEKAQSLSLPEFSEALVDEITEFTRLHPAWLPLLDATVKPQRDPDARKQLRDDLARILRAYDPKLLEERALLLANVSLEIVKGLMATFRYAAEEDRERLTREFKFALSLYLSSSLAC